MVDYTPLFVPGQEVTFTCTAAVTGGQLVALTGGLTVGPAGADARAVGVAGFDCASGGRVTVFCGALVHLTAASGAVTAGDELASYAGGLVGRRYGATNRVGIALASAANGADLRWLETPGPGPALAAKATGATAGAPGAFTPANSRTPTNLADLSGVTATPATDWTAGQYVVLADGSEANWNGTAWVSGRNPA